jgi:aminopeptidase-like protein
MSHFNSNLDDVSDKMGEEAYELSRRLFPICRSITGEGVRQTLAILSRCVGGGLRVIEVPSGEEVFDWVVPQEWNINDAYIVGPNGKKFAEFKKSNLHVVSYSTPIDQVVSRDLLDRHLYSRPDFPAAIPYVTSYYSRDWGFCIQHSLREQLVDGDYKVFIDSELKNGSLSYGEMILPGETDEEVFFSTYICHPSMGNNELSGPALCAMLIKYLLAQKRKFTYRFVFVPETIGAITYIAKTPELCDGRVKAAFNVTCVGDDRRHSFLPSRYGNTLTDKLGKHVLKHVAPDYQSFPFSARGSDERQYCWPSVDLPMVSLMRSKYGEYPEYHTSLDDLTFISPEGFAGSFEIFVRCIEALENNSILKTQITCEPHLSKRNLYATIGGRGNNQLGRTISNILIYSDGTNTILDIAELLGVPVWTLYEAQDIIMREGMVTEIKARSNA